jgi:HbrB-like
MESIACPCIASLQWRATEDPDVCHRSSVPRSIHGCPVTYSEDLNVLVKRHIQSVVSSFPSKALATLQNDVTELIASGMVTLNAKLMGIDDEKLVGRVVEIWGFFWDQVLTYVEGVSTTLFGIFFNGLVPNVGPFTATDGRIAVFTLSNA